MASGCEQNMQRRGLYAGDKAHMVDSSLMATLLCGLSINLELHFLGHRTFPTIEERYKYEMLC